MCYGCSISCHADHDLVELFQRRAFRCDCPTTSSPTTSPNPSSTTPTSTPCTLNLNPQPKNDKNRYTKNFLGSFCRCVKGETYDPMEEEESMICCLGCEEWVHEGCLVSFGCLGRGGGEAGKGLILKDVWGRICMIRRSHPLLRMRRKKKGV